MTVLGIDTSKWDGNWDAVKAKAAGAVFVYVKSSQATFTDVQFVASWKKAKEVGLLRGAYHYLDYSKPGASQANYFADLLKNDPGELPPCIDYEQGREDNDPGKALSFLIAFLDQLKTRSELYVKMKYKVPMIYTSAGFWSEYGDTTRREYWLQFPLWIANYTTASHPLLSPPWTMWHFWQFTGKGPGEAYGSESLSVDINRFNGTESELREFCGLPAAADATVITPPTANLSLQSLDKRTLTLEEALSKIKLSTEGGMITQVENLEQQIKSLAQSITNSHALLDGRLTSIEKKISTDGIPGSTTTPSTPVNGASDPVVPVPVTETPAPTPVPVEEPGLYATCKVNTLNVRKGAGTNYSVIANLVLGQRVKVLNRQDGWAQLQEPAGWAYDPYLAYDGTTPAAGVTIPPVEAGTVNYGVCNTSGLNVRSGPNNTYSIVGGLTYGQRVRIMERREGWAQIETPQGWCNEKYLSFS